jgi:hypothetical protein
MNVRLMRSGLLLLGMLAATTMCAATLSGELIDTYCYAHSRIAGPGHTACALKCAKAGVPLALLDDRTHRVYVLLLAQDAGPLPPALIALAGKRVTIDGDVAQTNGSTFLTVKSFAPAR